ncbi:UDP-glucose dehydrogenase family protein [Alkalilimnicola sp. S0819]|uniref:UDP-glucose dehydrogenase family protein n=1 Tax=Alkalilimnicola sp. S0819 TaxID=2613922 RepID=UPI00126286CC|nr:UDP-glucose/GDP-mannose dehydrogenase family protein [Alkalilimnicola sp. S0819]KAB7627874.1 UDP-glucose/GDP-mannose dehydrogenase family protein [Alkalilimnicola sp. S0819]MPQ15510.1 nucleotide sugar dehydrogenase [Alkalilimnicola sp. S0819]
MNITIFGSGYVGLVTGACFAEVGNHVLCVDVDEAKVDALNRGEVPIYEPGLGELLADNRAAGRLRFTTDPAAGVAHGAVIMIAVGTPADEDGSADLSHVLKVARGIAEHMDGYRLVVNKSTVPVGTADRVRAVMAETLARRGLRGEYDVVSNPEFLKEGAAVNDFMKPDRIVVGADSERAAQMLRSLYAPFNRNHDRLMVMDVRSAELTKYAANAMLATKISFMNELANLAERLQADIEQVRVGIGADPRIGYAFIYPGCGYGGSCFPKDVNALTRSARGVGYRPRLLEAVTRVNDRQKNSLFEKIHRHFDGELRGRCIALWGLSFKPNTDDLREAPSRRLMESLWAAGASVRAHDPQGMKEARRIYGERPDLVLAGSPEQALEGADALAVLTEWNVYRSPDLEGMRRRLRAPLVFDGRNLYDPRDMAAYGFIYYAVGRPSLPPLELEPEERVPPGAPQSAPGSLDQVVAGPGAM